MEKKCMEQNVIFLILHIPMKFQYNWLVNKKTSKSADGPLNSI